jgi:hypothetical protein
MRKHCFWLSFVLLFAASKFAAQTNPLKVCISQDGEGYDALRLARELSSRKLESGVSLAVLAIKGKALSAEEEHKLTDPGTPFARLLLKEQTAKARSAEMERLGCDYNIKVWYHESVDNFANPPAEIPSTAAGTPRPEPIGDRDMVGYELRKAGSNKVLARANLPPRTVYVRQGRRVFNPYPQFANQIVKKLNIVRLRPTAR